MTRQINWFITRHRSDAHILSPRMTQRGAAAIDRFARDNLAGCRNTAGPPRDDRDNFVAHAGDDVGIGG